MVDAATSPWCAPPPKNAKPSPGAVRALDDWLTSILCYRHRSAGRPWLFYEEIDKYLGPWGEAGYPIAYGKKYCQLFSQEKALQASPATRAWVEKTLLYLQLAIKGFILDRFRRGTLAFITESELRKMAFDSHPEAYTEGGLAMVAVVAPLMVLEIATIPLAEFLPTSRSFGATLAQVGATGVKVLPRAIALVLAGVPPAHTGHLTRAIDKDRQDFQATMRMDVAFVEAIAAIRAGRCDNTSLPSEILNAVGKLELTDRGLQRRATDLAAAIEERRTLVAKRYRREAALDPELKSIFAQFDPRAAAWPL